MKSKFRLKIVFAVCSLFFFASNVLAEQKTYIYTIQEEDNDTTYLDKYDNSGVQQIEPVILNGFAVAAGSNGMVYVVNPRGQQVLIYDSDGILTNAWTQKDHPVGIAIDPNGFVDVACITGSIYPYILKLDLEGRIVTEWQDKSLVYFGSISVDKAGQVYMVGAYNDGGTLIFKIGKYSNDGKFLGFVGEKINANPVKIVFDSSGNSYVLDFDLSGSRNMNVNVFDREGNFKKSFFVDKTTFIAPEFKFNMMTIDANDNLYIYCPYNYTRDYIHEYSTDGHRIKSIPFDNQFMLAIAATTTSSNK